MAVACEVRGTRVWNTCPSLLRSNKIIIIIPGQCLWSCHHGRAIARVHPVHLMDVERCQVAADPRPSQMTKAVSLPVQAARVYTHSPFIIITQPEGWYSFYRPMEGRRLSWPSWLVTYRDGIPAHRRSPILVLTGSDIAQLLWSRPTCYL